MPAEVEALIVELRREHPGWGPRTLFFQLVASAMAWRPAGWAGREGFQQTGSTSADTERLFPGRFGDSVVVLGRLPPTGAELFADLGPTTRRFALTVIARNVGDASTPIRLLSVGREMAINARTLGP